MASVSRILCRNSCRRITSLKTLCSETILSHNSAIAFCHGTNLGHRISQIQLYSSDTNSRGRILTESTLLAQDGIDIEELPILIKRATRSTLFPVTSHTYSGSKFLEETEFDNTFQHLLNNCCSVNDVFKLLEIPSEKVGGLSASLALQRLHVLKHLNTDWNLIHSFIRSAVMRELYDTVQRDVGLLSNNTLISLVECYLVANGFSPTCIEAVNNEIQSRIGDGTFSIEELLTLANILKSNQEMNKKQTPFFMGSKVPPVRIVSENASRFLSNDDDEQVKIEQFDKFSAKVNTQVKDDIRRMSSEMLNIVWVHLSSRYSEVNEHTLPLIMKTLTLDRKSFVKLLEKPLANFRISLTPEGIGTILDSLVRLNINSSSILTELGRWSFVHINEITPALLLQFLNAFIKFGFLDENLIKVMERCLSLKGQLAQTDVIAMCVEYCRSNSYLSPLVMDAAANHFTQYAYSYEPLQIFVVLRAYGQLNYLPSQPTAFLNKVESCLWDHFDHLPEVHLLEIMGSFTFVDVISSKLYNRVAEDSLYLKLNMLPSQTRICAKAWLRVFKQSYGLNMNSTSIAKFLWVISKSSMQKVHLFSDKQPVVKTIMSTLGHLLGSTCCHMLPFYGCCAIYLDKNGLPLKFDCSETDVAEFVGQIDKKLVILIRSSQHFIINTKQLVGIQALRMKHLKELGFIPIEVRASNIMYAQNQQNYSLLLELMKTYLKPFINFHTLKWKKSTRQKSHDSKKDLSCLDSHTDDNGGFSFTTETCNTKPFSQNMKINKSVSVEESGLLEQHPQDESQKEDKPD